MRILAVDDDPAFLELCEALLGDSDVELVTARSGEEAMGRLDEAPADVILVELHLPGVDGRTVARLIRERPDAARAVIGIVTDLADDGLWSLASDGIANFYASKSSLFVALSGFARSFATHGSG